MKIRKAVLSDAKGIAKVQVDTWRTSYKNIVPDNYLKKMKYESREDLWEKVIPSQIVYVAENEKEEIIGFASGGEQLGSDYPNYKGELTTIYVLEEYQNKRIGKLLFTSVTQDLVRNGIFSMVVYVFEENPSKYFYEYFNAEKIDQTVSVIEGKSINEIVYGWSNLSELLS